MNRRLHPYWFSGSGNTLRAAEAFAERLRELDWTVELRPLERSDPRQVEPMVMFGLAFPTHCFAIPEIVLTFVRSLPRMGGAEAMMLGTHGAFSGGVVGPMKRELIRKGFRCVAARILLMPDSFFPFFSDATNQRRLERAVGRAKRYAEDFAAGRSRWSRWPLLCDLHAGLFGGFFAARKQARKYFTTIHVQGASCRRCGTCVRDCPVGALETEVQEPPRPEKKLYKLSALRCRLSTRRHAPFDRL